MGKRKICVVKRNQRNLAGRRDNRLRTGKSPKKRTKRRSNRTRPGKTPKNFTWDLGEKKGDQTLQRKRGDVKGKKIKRKIRRKHGRSEAGPGGLNSETVGEKTSAQRNRGQFRAGLEQTTTGKKRWRRGEKKGGENQKDGATR